MHLGLHSPASPGAPEGGPARTGDALLAVRGVGVSFGGLRALDDVSLHVAPGEILGLIGPNGAGKTTVFNVVCGFVRPDTGELRWQGGPLGAVRPRQLAGLGIARTVQALGLFPHLTVLENVMVGGHRHLRSGVLAALLGLPSAGRDDRALAARARETLAGLGIEDTAPRLPGTLPYGVQKRVALARALVAEPRLLLLDEPASGLSEHDLDELAALIRSWRGDMAVILVEHHMDLVMEVCDRITVLDFGRVIADGPPERVRADRQVIDAYLGTAVGEEG